MSDDQVLLRALGRLDPAKKLEFLRAAKATITRFKAALDAKKQRAPTREDYEALEGVRRDAANLHESLARASRLGLPAEYLHEAWRNRQPGPEYEEYPDFDQLLWKLAQSAMWLMEDKRPAHRPGETWSHTAVIVRFLVVDFHQLFGEPTLGNGSPFVKFCRKFLPANGFKCPSLATLMKIHPHGEKIK